ncbi:MAG: hypothetical protein H7Z42_10850, partial [Roseiflexaceae bacterium]|nr:hypothetical protein [Roseiflexaceae bacterium]
ALLVDYLTRNNALTLDAAVKLRQTDVQTNGANTGIELSSEHVAVPLGSLQAGHLIVTAGAEHLTINGDAAQAELFRAHFGTLAPSVFVDQGLVKIYYRHALLNWNAGTADVTLHGGIPWRLDVVSSGAACIADLRSVPLSSLDVNGKASNIEITLPRPTAGVSFRIAGNASHIIVRRATGSAMQVRLGRGASNLIIDGQDFSAVGSKPYSTANYADTPQRYDIDVTARHTTVTIETYN